MLERNDFVDGAGFNGFFRHAKHDTSRFVLCNGQGARLSHGQESLRSVCTHAGQDNPKRIRTGYLGNRVKHDVHRWSMSVDWRPLRNVDLISSAAPYQLHVIVPRSDKRLPREDTIAVTGFLHQNLAERIEAVGKRRGKPFRHVLRDENGRRIGGHLLED